MFERINPAQVFMVHRYQVVHAVAVAASETELIVVPHEGSQNYTRVPASTVHRRMEDAIAENIRALEGRLMVERTRFARLLHPGKAENHDCLVVDDEYREIVQAAG